MLRLGLLCFQQWSRCHGDDWIELLSSESKNNREQWESLSFNESTGRGQIHSQLSDVELSCLLKVVLELVEMVGGQNVLRGTEIHPVFSPSRARASSKMNFPSANKPKTLQESPAQH